MQCIEACTSIERKAVRGIKVERLKSAGFGRGGKERSRQLIPTLGFIFSICQSRELCGWLGLVLFARITFQFWQLAYGPTKVVDGL